MIKQQWFVKMDEMIKPAVEGVKNGEIQLLPKRMEKTYFNWTDNIRDWCISRQLWWGHRIQYSGYILIVAVREIFYCELLSFPKLADLLVQSLLAFFRQLDSISFEMISAFRSNLILIAS